jgi:hypothetical protein
LIDDTCTRARADSDRVSDSVSVHTRTHAHTHTRTHAHTHTRTHARNSARAPRDAHLILEQDAEAAVSVLHQLLAERGQNELRAIDVAVCLVADQLGDRGAVHRVERLVDLVEEVERRGVGALHGT